MPKPIARAIEAEMAADSRDAGRDLGKRVPRVRTEHGTRVAQQITCGRCGSADMVNFIPRERDKALCRRCAAELLNATDEASNIAPPRPSRESEPALKKDKLRQAERILPKKAGGKPVLRVRRSKPGQ